MRDLRQQKMRCAEEERLMEVSEKLVAMAQECATIDMLAAEHLRERAAHWRSKAWLSRGGCGHSMSLIPPELTLLIAEQECTPLALLTMSAVNHGWRDALKASWKRLWRRAATARFPRVAALAAAEGTEKTWREIYVCQLARDQSRYHRARETIVYPVPASSEFVLSFTLTVPVEMPHEISGANYLDEKIVVDETHRLSQPPAGEVLASRQLWESPPTLLTQYWQDANRLDQERSESMRLTLWVSRGMKTVCLTGLHDGSVQPDDWNAHARVASFNGDWLGTGYYNRTAHGRLHMSFRDDGRLLFGFSTIDDRDVRTDNDSILRGFDRLLRAVCPTSSDLVWD